MTDEEVDALWEPGDAIDEALRLGVIDAARRHLAAGVPMVIWRDGRIVHVPAIEVLAELGAPVVDAGEGPHRTGRNGGAQTMLNVDRVDDGHQGSGAKG